MGHTPIPNVIPLNPESMLRGAYVHGKITLEQFEDAIGDALAGEWEKVAALCLPKPGGLPSKL